MDIRQVQIQWERATHNSCELLDSTHLSDPLIRSSPTALVRLPDTDQFRCSAWSARWYPILWLEKLSEILLGLLGRLLLGPGFGRRRLIDAPEVITDNRANIDRLAVASGRFEFQLADRTPGGIIQIKSCPLVDFDRTDAAACLENNHSFNGRGDVGLLGCFGVFGSDSIEKLRRSEPDCARRTLIRLLFDSIAW